jgi:S-layer protein (TIGR01567 family)
MASPSFPPELNHLYTSAELIGSGGFARVFKAKRKDGRVVAVKIPLNLDEATGRSFLREITSWQRLAHRNIVSLHDANILPIPYLELEYLEGGNLEDIQKPLEIAKACEIVFDIAEGLKYAHKQGIVHRDLKPHNILLTKEQVPKITDWGLSRVIAESKSSSQYSFSPVYAAPEQVSPKKFGKPDERTDIYQLGVIFYNLLTNELPFKGEDLTEIATAIALEAPVLPSSLNPEAQEVEHIVLTCIAKRKEDRYQSAGELQKELAEFIKRDYKESLKLSLGAGDMKRSAFYCAELCLVHARFGDVKEALKFALDLKNYAGGEAGKDVDALAEGLKFRMEKGLSIDEELFNKIEVVLHQVKMGWGKAKEKQEREVLEKRKREEEERQKREEKLRNEREEQERLSRLREEEERARREREEKERLLREEEKRRERKAQEEAKRKEKERQASQEELERIVKEKEEPKVEKGRFSLKGVLAVVLVMGALVLGYWVFAPGMGYPPETLKSTPTPTPMVIPSIAMVNQPYKGLYKIHGATWNEVPIPGHIGGNGNTATWDVYNFAGFYYDIDDNVGRESLQVLQTNLAANQRKIDRDKLVYSTVADAKKLKAFSNHPTVGGLEKFDAGDMSALQGGYNIVGWQAEPYVAVKGKTKKLAKLIIEHGNTTFEKKALTVGETWNVGGGWTVTANSIDAKASPRQVWLTLSKDGVKKDDKVIAQGQIYTYVEKSIAGEADVPLFLTYVDSIFVGATSDMVQLRYTWAIDTSITEIKAGDKFGIFNVVDATDNSLTLRNTDPVTLSQDATVDLMGNLKFKVADKVDVLRFMPAVMRTQPGIYDIHGAIWNEVPIAGSIGATGNIATWDIYNFAGFYYDINDNLGRESFQILQTNLAANQRTIDKDKLVYSTAAEAKRLEVVEKVFNNDVNAAATARLERTASGQTFANGNYYIVGWQTDRYVALNGEINKLAKLIIEQGQASWDKKSFIVGESWDIGDGWTLTAQSIDAKASPRQAWFVLSKDGVKKDDKVVAQGQVYTYVERYFAGESDVPLFMTYVDSVFAGATSDMVQVRYTWAISSTVNEIRNGDKFGIFKVVNLDTASKSLVLRNADLVSLSPGTTIDLIGNLQFKVADKADVLRFMPIAKYEI